MSKKLIEEKNDLIEQAQAIVDKAKVEERAMTEEEAAQFEELKAKVNAIAKTIGYEEDLNEMDEKTIKNDMTDAQPTAEETAANETRAFENYIRGVVTNERATNLVDGTNGAVIPTTIANRIWTKVADRSPILQKCTVYNTNGKLELPYYDESETSITVAFSDEFTSLSSNAGKFQKVELSNHLAGALTLVSKSLINNSDFDIVGFVVDQMSESIQSFLENVILNGDTDHGVKGLSDVKTVETASGTAITADEVIKLKDSVKDAYQSNAFFIMNSTTRTALRLLKDKNDRYLLNDDISSTFGTTLLGKDVYVSDNMPEIAAGKVAIYYGDFKGLVTKFSENIDIQVLRERYADMHAVGVVGWVEFDSAVADKGAIVGMKMKQG